MILFKKMLRDMLENKLAYIACIIVMSMGLMTYSSMSIVVDNLQNAKNEFYQDYQIADVFAQVRSYPDEKLDELKKLDGIRKVQGVFKQDYKVDFEDKTHNAYLKVISYNAKEQDRINDVHLSEGYSLDSDAMLAWVGKKFLEANNLKVNEKISLIINGKSVEFTIAGAVISPEYVYVTRNAQDIYPLPRDYEIAYISRDVLRKLTPSASVSTDLQFMLQPGYVFDDLKSILESDLKSYGLISLYPLKDQGSNAMLSEELKGVQSTSKSLPFLFLGISTFILYIMLKRLTETQRGQIGVLKAMGYSNLTIMGHYLSYSIFIGALGGLAGGLLGTQLSFVYTEMYKKFFSFPTLRSDFTYKYFGYGILLSVGFSIFAGYMGSRGILKLPPSMAMSPAAPKKTKRSRIEKIGLFWNSLTLQGRMSVRNLSRSRGRSFFTVIGLVFAFSLMVVSWSYNTMIDLMIFNQFKYVQLYDMKVGFTGPVNGDSMRNELYSIDGVQYVESVVEVPVQLKIGTVEKNTMIVVLDENTRLYNLLDVNLKKIPLDKEGLYLTENLAVQMKVKVGDILRVESPMTKDYLLMEIVSIFPQYLGSNGYINSKYLKEKTKFENIATTAYLNVEADKTNAIRKKLDGAPKVGVVEVRQETLNKYKDLMDSYGFMSYILAIISLVVGFSIVYNSSVISLSERQRELASMRVMGMSVEEVLSVVSFEQWILGAFSVVLGIPMSILMMESMKQAYQTDLYAMPSKIGSFAFILSVMGTAAFIYLSQINVKRRIRNFDIVEVLKERE